jgi:bifunctional UDP-N-acetylglucosamine pyrophosphorylase/glucosamine-1-phosphate N-acetyltransferase
MRGVVLAAGRGVRLQPLTLTKPKSILPVGGKPLVSLIIEALADINVKEILIILSQQKEKISKVAPKIRGLKLAFRLDSDPKGTGSSLRLAEKFVGGKPFLLVYGDLYFSRRLLAKFFTEALKILKGKTKAVVGVVEAENPQHYGVVVTDRKGKLLKILEKPKKSGRSLINAGIYLFNSEIFSCLNELKPSPRGELELTEALNILAKNEVVQTVKLPPEEWVDIGRPGDLLEANKLRLKEVKGEIKGQVESNVIIRGEVIVEEKAIVRVGSYIEGPVFIGSGSEIGPYARIRAYTSIGRNVRVGSFCEVKSSIIMNGAKIPHLCYIGDSIIGENCNFGAGTLVGNLRLDEKPVKITVKGVKVSSGLRKLGAIIGDEVKTAINVSIMPGVKIGPRSWIGPVIAVSRDIPPDTMVLGVQSLVFKPLREGEDR